MAFVVLAVGWRVAVECRTLGHTGVKISPLCLGTMMFGAMGDTDHVDSVRVIHQALDAGINFIDTADIYSAGESEQISPGLWLEGSGTMSYPQRSAGTRWETTRISGEAHR